MTPFDEESEARAFAIARQLIQDHVALRGEMLYIGAPSNKAYDRAPIKLQAHGDPSAPLNCRDIWVRNVGGAAE